MSNTTQTVNFHGQSIITLQKSGKIYTAIKPICENIGLQWDAQFRRIKRDEVLNSTVAVMAIVAEDGKKREMLCLPIDYLSGWLFGISDKRVKTEIRNNLITYKKECYQVLHDYWTHGKASNPRFEYKANPNDNLSIEQADTLRDLLKDTAEKLPKAAKAKFMIQGWSKLKSHFGVSYRDICALSTYSRNTSFIRVCQPLPPALKKSNTWASKRTVVDCLGLSQTGRPPLLRAAAERPKEADANIWSVHSGLSASTISGLGLFNFFIVFYFSFVGFSQTNHAGSVASKRINQSMQPRMNHAQSKITHLTIHSLLSFQNAVKVKIINQIKRQPAFFNVALVFVWVIFNLHAVIVVTTTKTVKYYLTTPTNTRYAYSASAKKADVGFGDLLMLQAHTRPNNMRYGAFFVSACLVMVVCVGRLERACRVPVTSVR